MNKQEFLEKLRKNLSELPQKDVEERLNFYNEMIEDRIEEGLTEEQAVLDVGPIDEIVSHAYTDIPFDKPAKKKIKLNRRMKPWEIILLSIGSPLWVSLIIAAVAVILSLYISLWSVVISLWSVFVSLLACFFGAIKSSIIFIYNNNALSGLVVISAGLICAGLSIFMFYGCKKATEIILNLTKNIPIWIRRSFNAKEK